MKRANSTGSIAKLSGRRRRPYVVRITEGKEIDEDTKTVRQIRTVVGYYATKKEALDALEAYNQNPYTINTNKITVGQVWAKVFEKLTVAEERKRSYQSLYNRYIMHLDDLPIRELRYDPMQQVIDSVTQGSATKTKLAAIFHKTFEYAIQNGIVQTDYSRYIKFEQDEVKMHRRLFTSEEVTELWNKEPSEERDFTLCLLYSGMRIKELRELETLNVDLETKMMSIVIAKNKRSIRTVPIHERILPILAAHYDKTNKYVFAITKNKYELYMKGDKHTPYDTRHTFATKCNELGIEKLKIQRIMGHTPDSVLEQTYIHLKDAELLEAINRVDY